MAKSQITAKSEHKKAAPKSAWKPGQSGNPGGRPKAEKSITHWLNEFGNKSPQVLAAELTHYAADLKKVKGDLPIFGHVAIRTLMAIINEPDARLLAQVLDRTEGKVSQPIELKPDAVLLAKLQELGLTLNDVRSDPLAAELFALAGLASDAGNAAAGTVSGEETD